MARSSGVKWDKSGLLGPTWTPVVDPVELPGPKPELVEAANPESDIPPPELPILLPRALRVAARLLLNTPPMLVPSVEGIRWMPGPGPLPP